MRFVRPWYSPVKFPSAVALAMALMLLVSICHVTAATKIVPEDARNIMRVSEVRRGMRGYGLTVFHGTKIEKFDVEILGVLKKANMGKDLIIVRCGGGPITKRQTGIIAGMSGSPVYVKGKLVGAVAYGSGFAREPVGMLTPIEDMLEALDPNLPKQASGYSSTQPLSEPVTVNGRTVRKIMIDEPGSEERGIVGDTLHMQPLMTPLMVSGMSQRGIEQLSALLRPYRVLPVRGPGGGAKPGVKADLAPGSAFGVSLATGDIDITGVGTLTYRRGDKVIGFGHPMLGIGAIDAPMTTAFVDDIISSFRVSNKLASPIKVVGRVFQDRPWSVAGTVGKMPKTVSITVTVDDQMFKRFRTYRVNAVNHPLLASGLCTAIVSEAIYQIHPTPGDATAEVTYEVVADQIGKIKRSNVFFDPVTVESSSVSDMGALLQLLSNNPFHALDVMSLNVKVRIFNKRNTAHINRIFVKKSDYEPGDEVEVGVVMRPYKKDRITKTYKVKIPATASDGKIILQVRGGGTRGLLGPTLNAQAGEDGPALAAPIMDSSLANADNVKQLISKYLEREKNNEVVVQLLLRSTAINVAGEKLSGLPSTIADMMKSSRNSGLRMERDEVKQVFAEDMIVTGAARLMISVKRKDLKEAKSSPRPISTTIDEPDTTTSMPTMDPNEPDGFDAGTEDPMPSITGVETVAALEDKPSVTVTEKTKEDEVDEDLSKEDEPADSESTTNVTESTSAPSKDVKTVVRQVKSWIQRTQADFAKGTFSGVTASSKNKLELAPTLKKLAETPEQFVWCAAPAKDGIYAGTGNSGRIYHITDSGESKIFYETGELEVYSLATDAAGNLYAGTGPHGKIFKITPDGNGSVVHTTTEKYVVCLALDGEGNLYAGVGDAGKVYRIAPDGSAVNFADTGEQQVLSLAWDKSGSLLAGTGINGIVYRIDKQGKATPIFDANEDAVTSILVDAIGNVYASTAPKGSIYKISPDGMSRPIYAKSSRILSMTSDAESNIYAVSDNTVVRMSPDETLSTVDSSQDKIQFISVMFNHQTDSLYATTGNIGSVYISKCCDVVGTFESPVHDTKMISKWGRVKWVEEKPEGTSVELQIRVGNVATPDLTWSGWSSPYTNSSGEQIVADDARYVQYRVTLKTSKANVSPKVSNVTLTYLTPNQKPKVTISAPVGGAVWSGKKTIAWTGSDPDKDTLTYDVFYSNDNGKTWVALVGGLGSADEAKSGKEIVEKIESEIKKSPDVPEDMKKKIMADENKEKQIKPPANNGSSTNTSYSWDTKGVKDGIYVLKVVASDKASNGAKALSDEVVSDPFTICNSAPKLTLRKKTLSVTGSAKPEVTGSATSELIEIAGVQYRVDGGPWMAATPIDGAFDSPTESFSISPEKLSSGKHTIEVQAIDAAGNAKSETVDAQVS